MAESIVEICNSALVKIGAKTILSLTDDSKEANICSVRYNPVRRMVLRSHPWNSAIKRVVISPLTTTPVFGTTNQFELPADCLRVLEVNYSDDCYYRIEGRTIQVSADEINLKYVYDLKDTGQMDSLLSEAIGTYLAFDISYAITEDSAVQNAMAGLWSSIVRTAKTVDGQEDSRMFLDASEWMDSRINGAVDNATRDRYV
jgi:hypothetical protein